MARCLAHSGVLHICILCYRFCMTQCILASHQSHLDRTSIFHFSGTIRLCLAVREPQTDPPAHAHGCGGGTWGSECPGQPSRPQYAPQQPQRDGVRASEFSQEQRSSQRSPASRQCAPLSMRGLHSSGISSGRNLFNMSSSASPDPSRECLS